MRIRSFFSLLLAFALLMGTAAAEGHYPDKEHLPVDFADMERGGFDEAGLQAALEELETLCGSSAMLQGDGETREQIQDLYTRILGELDILATQSALAEIYYDANGAEQSAADAAAQLSEQTDRLYDAVLNVLAQLADGPCKDILEADIGKEMAEALRHYDGMTEEESALYREEDQLVQAYDQAMAEPVIIDGAAWTMNDLEAADLDDDTYWDLYQELEKAQNEAVGEIYRQLVQVRTKIAQAAGCDDYAEYAYEALYSRDYSLEDLKSVREAVKKYLVPLSEELYANIQSTGYHELDTQSHSTGEEILDAIQPFMEETAPELGESFAFMREHHLYDIEASPSKLPVGYTIGLPAYGSAFIFNSPYGTYQDYSDMVHEFGHFNETFHATTHDLWADFNIDVGEIHSQALELFFTAYADQVFPHCGYTYTSLIVYNLLDSVLEGCMYDEFQAAVYQNPDMTLEEINCTFKDISEQYGYYYGSRETESYFWVQISHNFQSPMYYTSYATSALSALELWLWYLEDRDEAVECYMELSALSLDVPYRTAVKQAGLKDIFRPGVVKGIAKDLEAAFERNWQPKGWEFSPAVILWPGAAAVVGLAAFTISRRKREQEVSSRWQPKEDLWGL